MKGYTVNYKNKPLGEWTDQDIADYEKDYAVHVDYEAGL